MEQLKETNTQVIFETEEFDIQKTDSRLMISIMESFAQAENESRSDNIKWGNKQRAADGTSKLYDRKCYGYANDENGKLIIVDKEAEIVKLVFNWYLQDDRDGGIVRKLKRQGIKTSSGKDNWPKRTGILRLAMINMLEMLLFSKKNLNSERYLYKKYHPAVISEETFKAVQIEKGRRSNAVVSEDGATRRSRKYSSKKEK